MPWRQELIPMSEDTFFHQLFKTLPPCPIEQFPVGPGDDCAAIAQGNGSLLLIAADQVIANRHFLPSTPPEEAGRKLLARNLSDIAAMGGTPSSCLVCLSFCKEQNEDWLFRFYRGIITEAQKWQVHMIGGDIAQAPHDCVASLTILGYCEEGLVIRRQGAKSGDLLCATGHFGRSFESQHHLYFTPRLLEGKWLADHQLAQAMMDVSDGLALDASRLAEAANCGIQLDLTKILKRDQATMQQALFDGEDYELIFAVSPHHLGTLLNTWPFSTQLTVIGTFTTDTGIIDQEGHSLDLSSSWDHLSP